jgi:hypothetical protein
VPPEASDWLSGATSAEAAQVCGDAGIEIAFPKPFCAFDPPPGSILAEFRDRFRIGRPDVRLAVHAGSIRKAQVRVSAACGATYYVARWLVGRSVDDDLAHEVARRMHSYPCTASMAWDEELGDTPLHVASQAHSALVGGALGAAARSGESGMVRSPLGTMVPTPVPVRENVAKIERAKDAVLEDLAAAGAASFRDLRSRPGISPAALSTALLLLKGEGRIRVDGDRIRLA